MQSKGKIWAYIRISSITDDNKKDIFTDHRSLHFLHSFKSERGWNTWFWSEAYVRVIIADNWRRVVLGGAYGKVILWVLRFQSNVLNLWFIFMIQHTLNWVLGILVGRKDTMNIRCFHQFAVTSQALLVTITICIQ